MALTVEVSDEETEALTEFAAARGMSAEEAACEAVRYYLTRRSFEDKVARLTAQDRGILDRLAD